MDKYAVFGNPISHSKSPLIHSMFALQTEQKLSYTTELIEVDRFAEQAAKSLKKLRGANVTMPFKQDAFELVDMVSRRARQAGAVNTIVRQVDGTLLGDNTDGIGLVNDIIKNLHLAISGKRILLLGAGGAVRGAIGTILAQEPELLHVANRTPDKAAMLAQAFNGMGNIKSSGLDDVEGGFDIIINGTSASLKGQLPKVSPACFTAETACYDMMYSVGGPTVFLQWAHQMGCIHLYDGLGMLVEQAAEAFELWRGVRPLTAPVINFLRQQSSND